jgi:hypothetical protein
MRTQLGTHDPFRGVEEATVPKRHQSWWGRRWRAMEGLEDTDMKDIVDSGAL